MVENPPTELAGSSLETWWCYSAAEYERRTWRDYRRLLGEVILDSEGGPLLDVGCGIGYLVECARRFGIPAIGLEGSSTALRLGRKRHPHADLRDWLSGTPLPVADRTVGSAVLNEFVDHVSREDNELLFTELQRVLRPGGTLIVNSPSRYNKYDDDPGHVTFFSPSEFRSFVEYFGFEVVRQPYVPLPLLGSSRFGWLTMRAVALIMHPERWAARIDLTARKPDTMTS